MMIFGSVDRVELRSRRGWIMGIGLCLVLLGGAAVSMPFMASVAIETLIGWLMVGAGAVQAVNGYRQSRRGRGGWGDFLWALLAAITGVILLAKPISGVVTLTMILSVYFVLEGVFKIVAALRLRGIDGWLWVLGSGVMALLLGCLIWHNFFAAAWGVGLLVGINLLCTGSTFIALGVSLGREV